MTLRTSRTAWTCAAALLFAFVSASAQIPQKINYQVMLTDNTDQPLADQSVQMVFAFYAASSGGSALWTETQDVATNSIGVVSVILGAVNPIDIPFDAPRWLEVEVDGETLSPRREIVTAPYAGRAATAENSDKLGDIDASEYVLLDDIDGPGTVNSPGNPVDWTMLKSVPAGFADGTDEGGGTGDGHSLDADDGSPVDALYVDGEGKVGIGTTTPVNELHVQGSARLQDYGLGATALLIASGDPFHIGVGLYSYDEGGGYIQVSHQNGFPAVAMGPVSYAGGGGSLSLMRDDSGNPAFTMTGNSAGSGEPRMDITGTTSDIVFDLSETMSDAVQLPASAIDAGEIWNEPGASSAQSATPVSLAPTLTVREINNCSVYAPGGGYVLAIATAEAVVDHPGPSTSRATFGVSRQSDAFSDYAQESELRIPAGSAAGEYKMAVSVSALFQVPHGTWSFYFVGMESGSDWEVGARQFTTVFIPSAYGTIDTTD